MEADSVDIRIQLDVAEDLTRPDDSCAVLVVCNGGHLFLQAVAGTVPTVLGGQGAAVAWSDLRPEPLTVAVPDDTPAAGPSATITEY